MLIFFKLLPMKSLTSILLICACSFYVSTSFTHAQNAADPFGNIKDALEKGNSKVLAEYFNTTIDLSVPGKENIYSKVQAELIIKEFFFDNKPVSFRINHKGKSNDGSQYAIGTFKTSDKSFRSYFLVKKTNGKYLIHQMEIEEQ